MNTKTCSVLSLIAVLFFISLTDCSGGGSSGNPVISTSAIPTATVSGLVPNTKYYFAVSAYNGRSGLCSNEVQTVTPPSGDVSLAWDAVQNQKVSAYDVHYGKQPSPGPPGNCTYSDSKRYLLRLSAKPLSE